MKKCKLLFFVASLLLVLFSISCRKVDVQVSKTEKVSESKFFNSHRSADATEAALVKFIMNENNKKHFVENAIKQIGYPRWDKIVKTTPKNRIAGRGSSDSSLATYYVPFVRDSQNFVNASMIINTYATDTSFSYKCDWQYSERQNNLNSYTDSAEYYAIFFMMLDKTVFGHTSFEVTDTLLFRNNSLRALRIQFNSSVNAGRNYLLEPTTVCENVTVYWQDCPWLNNNQHCDGPGVCDNCSACTASISIQYCWQEWIETGGGGGGSGGTGGTAGGSGDGSGNPPNNPCGGVAAKGAVQEGCQPGWTPGGGTNNYPPPEPIDSMLNRYSRIINNTADSIFTLSQANNKNEEWGFIIVQNAAGEIYAKACTTAHNDQYVRLDRTLAPGERIIGELHTHPDAANNPLDRSAPTGSDFNTLKINSRERYTSFVDCGNIRYAIVVENVDLSRTFFSKRENAIALLDNNAFNNAQTKPNYTTNWQNATEVAIIELIGNSTVSGIGFYKSDATKTNFIKLN